MLVLRQMRQSLPDGGDYPRHAGQNPQPSSRTLHWLRAVHAGLRGQEGCPDGARATL